MDCKPQKKVTVAGDVVTICYENLEEGVWRRIKTAATFLSEKRIGPRVDSIDEKTQTIIVEKVSLFASDEFDVPPPLARDVERIRTTIASAVGVLHSYNWVHGDLSLYNIGYRDDLEIAFFDYDTIHEVVTEHVPKWLSGFREEYKHSSPGETYQDIFTDEETSWYDNWLNPQIADMRRYLKHIDIQREFWSRMDS